MLLGGEATVRAAERPRPKTLDHGLEILDYRVLPTEDINRFLVEVHNTTDAPIKAPLIGFVDDQFPTGKDFAFAMPAGRIVHPQASLAYVGVAPEGLVTDADWGDPEWGLCQAPGKLSEELQAVSRVSVETQTEPWHGNSIHLFGEVTNHDDEHAVRVYVEATCFDLEGRLCGASKPWWVGDLVPNESREFHMWVGEDAENIASPFVLVDSVSDLNFVVSAQPPESYLVSMCTSVMPWGR